MNNIFLHSLLIIYTRVKDGNRNSHKSKENDTYVVRMRYGDKDEMVNGRLGNYLSPESHVSNNDIFSEGKYRSRLWMAVINITESRSNR